MPEKRSEIVVTKSVPTGSILVVSDSQEYPMMTEQGRFGIPVDDYPYVAHLGDIVGSDTEISKRNIDALRVIEGKVGKERFFRVAGNHDLAVYDEAQRARWLRLYQETHEEGLKQMHDDAVRLSEALSRDDIAYLSDMPDRIMLDCGGRQVILVHRYLLTDSDKRELRSKGHGGALRNVDMEVASRSFQHPDFGEGCTALFGHSHMPAAWIQDDGGNIREVIVDSDSVMDFEGRKRIYNAGSLDFIRAYPQGNVGQFVETNKRCYAVLDAANGKFGWHFI